MSDNIEKVNNPEEENSVTMVDVLQDVNEQEEEVNAVLGASDENNCTYNKGYFRQALYACKTCCSKGTRAALCFACSLHCHEGHELIELYTKRHVKCDCGNSKFGDKSCSLEPIKEPVNEENNYNQNYDGVYCICSRPYPDPDTDEDDNEEMLQCVVCEDWFHSKHLEGSGSQPKDMEFSEMICNWCMDKHQFLWNYAPKYSVINDQKIELLSGEAIDVEAKSSCSLPKKNDSEPIPKGTCYWSDGWRLALCKCTECQEVYKKAGISFLIDPLDSVQVYEEAGKANHEPFIEKGMKALASLGHVQQMNAIEEYNIMKENLKEYLRKFAENKKVVREEDITEFFTALGSKKRQRVITPTYCR